MTELPLAILLWMLVILLVPITVGSIIGIVVYLMSKG
jgi:hypothetical protein